MSRALRPEPPPLSWADDDASSLPAWIYRDPEFFEANGGPCSGPAGKLICHLSDIPRAGDYHVLELLGSSCRPRAMGTRACSVTLQVLDRLLVPLPPV